MSGLIKLIAAALITVMGFTAVLGVNFKAEVEDVPVPMVKQIAKHVVSYNILKRDNSRYATGFHVEYMGRVYILTNKHVCDLNAREVHSKYIQFEDYVGRVLSVSKKHDLCLVTSNRNEGLELAWDKPEPMDELILIGHPRGLGKTIRKGYYVDTSDIYAQWIGDGSYEAMMVSTIAYGGNSGSPVCNTDGEVTGVLFAGSMRFHTEGLVVPLKYIRKFLDEYLNSEIRKSIDNM